MVSVKSFLLITLLLFNCSFKLDKTNYPEKIDWDTHFRASPDVNSNYAAVTNTIWHYSYTATMKGKKLTIDFNFLAGVDPDKSWVNRSKIRSKQASEALLNHEQGHVYINFLQLKNGEILIKNQPYTIGNFKQLVAKKAKEVSKFYNDLQVRYDVETKHGADLKAQSKWDVYFETELRKFQ